MIKIRLKFLLGITYGTAWILFILARQVCGEIIFLKSGKVIEGKKIEETAEAVRLNVWGQEMTFFKDSIQHIEVELPINDSGAIRFDDKKDNLENLYFGFVQVLKSGQPFLCEQFFTPRHCRAIKDLPSHYATLKGLLPEKFSVLNKIIEPRQIKYLLKAFLNDKELRGDISFVEQDNDWKIDRYHWSFIEVPVDISEEYKSFVEEMKKD